MGGGAGITFTAKLESIPIRWTRGEWRVTDSPEIDNWQAGDYMNCLSNIRPNLLKVVSATVSEAEPDMESVRHAYSYHGEQLGRVLHTDTSQVEGMVFAGYMRGAWEEMFPFDLTGQLHLQYYGDLDLTLTVTYRNKRQFDLFYRSLFESYRSLPDNFHKWSEARRQRLYDNQWDKLVERFGA